MIWLGIPWAFSDRAVCVSVRTSWDHSLTQLNNDDEYSNNETETGRGSQGKIQGKPRSVPYDRGGVGKGKYNMCSTHVKYDWSVPSVLSQYVQPI